MVATVAGNGMPQLTPNWYRFADGRLTMSTMKARAKFRNLSRDARLSVCIYSEPRATEYAIITGRVEITDDESIWPPTRAIIERYVPPDGVDDRLREMRTQNRVLVRMEPERVLFRT